MDASEMLTENLRVLSARMNAETFGTKRTWFHVPTDKNVGSVKQLSRIDHFS